MIPNRTGKTFGEGDRERMSKIRRMQSEQLILEQDIRKKRRALDTLTAEIRRMKSERTRLETSLREKTSVEGKLTRDMTTLEAELSRMKKRLNALS